MQDEQKFVDYYDLLQVNPECDQRILEVAFHYFAKMYHPDNSETADTDKFHDVTEAYKVLRDPVRRKEFDLLYAQLSGKPFPQASLNGDIGIDENTAQADSDMHARILFLLYRRRREHPGDSGIVGWLLQEELLCPEATFEFHVWYLKAKGFVSINEQGKYAITVDGVDQVIALGRTSSFEKKLLSRPVEDEG